MNLREALLQSSKPRHQFHDSASLDWLLSNRPKFPATRHEFSRPITAIIKEKAPWKLCEPNWFSNKLTRNGIHGFRHCCRVAINSILLAFQNQPNIADAKIKALLFAALLHDCRRKNDNADSYHGKRTAEWLDKNIWVLPRCLEGFYESIRFAIYVHNDPYEEIVKKPSYQKFKFFVDILKTADALDRYRFPREDWWLNLSFIILHPNIESMGFAYDLMLESETLYLHTKNNQFSIAKALQKII